MRINDVAAGLLFLAISAALATGAWGLANPSAQPFGPGAFPILVAVLLGICSVVLLAASTRDPGRGPFIAVADWTRSPAHVLRFLLVPGSIAFYVLFVGELGFLFTGGGILMALFIAGRVPWARAAVMAVAIPLVVHSLFYIGLKVQLPWGLLEPIRW
jgi:putative tricarboxylic transport membrane protein